MKVLILDTETTGLVDPQACEIAFITLPDTLKEFRELEIKDTKALLQFDSGLEGVWSQRFRPTKPIDSRASAVTGIYMKDVIGCPSIKTFNYPESNEFLVAHNAVYDWGVLGKPEVKRICTKELAQLVFPKGSGAKNNKLTTLATWMYKEHSEFIDQNAHGALFDCKLVYLILKGILEKLPQVETWDDLAKLCSQGSNSQSYEKSDKPVEILKEFNFGKHAGVPIERVPKDYLQWLLKQERLDPSTKATCLEYLK